MDKIKHFIACAVIALITLAAFAQVPTDKKYHAGAGIIIGSWGTFVGNSLDLKPEYSALFGLGSAAVAGLGKELWDEIDYGGWDWKDFGATMIGGAIGAGLTYTGLKIFKKKRVNFYGNLLIITFKY